MRKLNLSRAFTLMESGPVVLVTTYDGKKNNITTVSWTMVLDFTPAFAITTADLLDKVVGIGTCSGADTDKYARFHLTPVRASRVHRRRPQARPQKDDGRQDPAASSDCPSGAP